jgi:hypothetical protein
MRSLLALGHDLLTAFVAHQGDGDRGPEVETADGRIVRRLPEPHERRYVSIFGELTMTRVVYGTREGQKLELVPLDERLGLPEGEFSYVLEDWGQRFCLKESFAEAGRSLVAVGKVAISSGPRAENQRLGRSLICSSRVSTDRGPAPPANQPNRPIPARTRPVPRRQRRGPTRPAGRSAPQAASPPRRDWPATHFGSSRAISSLPNT